VFFSVPILLIWFDFVCEPSAMDCDAQTVPQEYLINSLRRNLETSEKTIDTLRTAHLLDIRDVKRACGAEMTRAMKGAKAEQSERDAIHGKKILKLLNELQELRQPKGPAEERAIQAEMKVARLEVRLKKQTEEAVKYRNMETLEELKERVRIAEEDWNFAQDRCNILQTNMDDARKRMTTVEASLTKHTHELEEMAVKLHMANVLVNHLKLERKREGKGEIFVEDGRVLFRCFICMEVRFLVFRLFSFVDPRAPTVIRRSHRSCQREARPQGPTPSLRALPAGMRVAASSQAPPVPRPAVGIRHPHLRGDMQEPVGVDSQGEV
jgi:hypothetical protein